MTQQQLADKVGIKFQQIQKYETGMNRVSASRLWDIARAVDVPVSFFFEGLSEGEVPGVVEGDIFADKEALQLVRAYYAMPEAASPDLRAGPRPVRRGLKGLTARRRMTLPPSRAA